MFLRQIEVGYDKKSMPSSEAPEPGFEIHLEKNWLTVAVGKLQKVMTTYHHHLDFKTKTYTERSTSMTSSGN